jgi:hypothetical protein
LYTSENWVYLARIGIALQNILNDIDIYT